MDAGFWRFLEIFFDKGRLDVKFGSLMERKSRNAPGKVRDALVRVMSQAVKPLAVKEIENRVESMIGPTPNSSIRSYLRLNTPDVFVREERGKYRLRNHNNRSIQREFTAIREWARPMEFGKSMFIHADCFDWLEEAEDDSIHAVVTDPPYGLHEYSAEQQAKLRNGKGGVWRIPPSFDGNKRSPLPRFTTLTPGQLEDLKSFFRIWGRLLFPKLVPGAHVLVASNPLVSYLVSGALSDAGFERRGEIIRLTMTMRGGDRPKDAHQEFSEVSVMPRSMWEPWLVYRKPCEGRVQDNLRKWKTGGFRRPDKDKPFGDVIASGPTRKAERALAPHPSLKPQAFLRQIVRAVLPLGEGVVLDPFAGAGSTIAACEAVGYRGIGLEKDRHYFEVGCAAIPKLTDYQGNGLVKSDKSSYSGAF
jgi:site-specific DNA-methyltransferase (adenine-specific)